MSELREYSQPTSSATGNSALMLARFSTAVGCSTVRHTSYSGLEIALGGDPHAK